MQAAADAKRGVRARHLAARAALSPGQLAAAADRLVSHLLGNDLMRGAVTVAAYVPIGSEPGGNALLPALSAAGVEVLLPIVVPGGPLDWAVFDGALAPGPIGLREPAGRHLGAAALAGVDVVLVPGLAVDLRGSRLGRGAGYYDRSLPFARSGVPLMALLHDGELLDDELPAEWYDVPVTHAVTPASGVLALR